MVDVRIKDLGLATLDDEDSIVVDSSAEGTVRATIAKLREAIALGAAALFFDDFRALDEVEWASPALTGSATATIIDAATAPATIEGVGWLRLLVTSAVGDQAQLAHQTEHLRGGMDPVFQTRIKVPAVFADATFVHGFLAASGTTYARLGTNTSGQWRCEIASTVGGGSQAVDVVTPTPTAGGIYDVRIEVEAAVGVRFYIDNTLLQTLSQANAIPTAADRMLPYLQVDRVANGGSVFFDYVLVTGAR